MLSREIFFSDELWGMSYGLRVMGYGLWVMGYGRVMNDK